MFGGAIGWAKGKFERGNAFVKGKVEAGKTWVKGKVNGVKDRLTGQGGDGSARTDRGPGP